MMTMEILITALVSIFAAIIGASVVVVGWNVTHRNEMNLERAAKRRELQVEYLIDAFRRLEYVSNRPITSETAPDFEKAIAEIQLFGSAKQVELAQQFSDGMARNKTHSLDPLLADLRRSLREELDLEYVPNNIKYLRFSFPPTNEIHDEVQHDRNGSLNRVEQPATNDLPRPDALGTACHPELRTRQGIV
jgi:hypothetical protein